MHIQTHFAKVTKSSGFGSLKSMSEKDIEPIDAINQVHFSCFAGSCTTGLCCSISVCSHHTSKPSISIGLTCCKHCHLFSFRESLVSCDISSACEKSYMN